MAGGVSFIELFIYCPAHLSEIQGLAVSAALSSSHASFRGQKKNSVTGLRWPCTAGERGICYALADRLRWSAFCVI